jgi:hypothetical protein
MWIDCRGIPVSAFLLLLNVVSFPPAAAAEPCGMQWATFLGASGDDRARRVAVGPDGSILVVGPSRNGADFPEAESDMGLPFGSGDDVVVLRLSADGQRLLWRAVLAGPGDDWPRDMSLDASGRIVLAGYAGPGFPTTANALQPDFGGGLRDGFLAILDPFEEDSEAQLVYSSYVGGEGIDAVIGAHVDGSGKLVGAAYTSSRELPTTPGSFGESYRGGSLDAYVFRIDPEIPQLLFSTFLGGTADEGIASDFDALDASWGTALTQDGALVVTGHTSSSNFPVLNNAADRSHGGSFDVFVARIRFNDADPQATPLDYATFLGGVGFDAPEAVTVAADGAVVLTGYTSSTDFPTTVTAHQRVERGFNDTFLVRLDTGLDGAAQITYSTFFGGGEYDVGQHVAMLGDLAVFCGFTASTDLPRAGCGLQAGASGGQEGFLAAIDLNPMSHAFGKLRYAAYRGGAGDDVVLGLAPARPSGALLMSGATASWDFPVTPGALQEQLSSPRDMFLAELDLRLPTAVASATPTTGREPLPVHLSAAGSSSGTEAELTTYLWRVGPGITLEGPEVDHVFSAGRRAVSLTVTNELGHSDTVSLIITVEKSPRFLRADANGDATIDLSDAVFTLIKLFQTGEELACLAAADANDDDKVDISDPIHLLAFLFLGGPAPPAPHPACAPQPQDSVLACAAGCP